MEEFTRSHRIVLFAVIWTCFSWFSRAQSEQSYLIPGEKLTYSMNYGWFTIGHADVWVDPEIFTVNGETYYNVQSNFHTSGFIGFFKSINTCYESLVHTETGKPYISHRDLAFGNSIDVRTDKFTYADSLYIYAYVEDVDSHRYHTFFDEPPIFDFLSTYVRVRHMDLSHVKDTIALRTFYSNSMNQLNMQPVGPMVYEWNDGELPAHEFLLGFPENELFKKDRQGAVILRHPGNIPLRIDLNVLFGKVHFKLESIEYY